jgi:AraC family transcriptional regulator of adaptative response / DNA-3-methyladenine glycosylase II
LRAARPGRGARVAADGASGVPLRLAYRGPYDSGQVFDFLAARVVPGVEEMTGEPGARTYRRTLRLPHAAAVAEVAERPGAGGWLECRLHLGDLRDLTTATQRVRRLFDLDADPFAVAERLGADPELAPLVAARPGLRAPGAADPEELAVVEVLGTGAGPERARESAGRLVAGFGEPLAEPSGSLTHAFPRPSDVAEADLSGLGLATEQVAAVRSVTAALASGKVRLDPGADREQAERDLLALPGVTPWTAALIRMRGLGDPDVLPFPEAPGAAAWRPWCSYAAHHLWAAASSSAGLTAAGSLS